jgi:hypothetical protein
VELAFAYRNRESSAVPRTYSAHSLSVGSSMSRSDNLGFDLGGELGRIPEPGPYMCTVTEWLLPRMTASAQHCGLHRAYTRRCDDGELTCH